MLFEKLQNDIAIFIGQAILKLLNKMCKIVFWWLSQEPLGQSEPIAQIGNIAQMGNAIPN